MSDEDFVWVIHVIRQPSDASPVDQAMIDEFHADRVAWETKYSAMFPHQTGAIRQLMDDYIV